MKCKHIKIPRVSTLEVNCPSCGSLNTRQPAEPNIQCYRCSVFFSEWTGGSLNCFHCNKPFHWHKNIGIFHGNITNDCYKPEGGFNH